MLRIPTSLIGVNLTENENIFLGAFIKINSVSEVFLFVDNSDTFTDQLNGIIDAVKKTFKASKDFADFFKQLKYASNTRFMLYDKLLPINNEGADAKMVIGEVKKLYMNAFRNINIIEKTVKGAEKVEKAPVKKQSKNKEDNK